MAVELSRTCSTNDAVTIRGDRARRKTPTVAQLGRCQPSGLADPMKITLLLIVGATVVAAGIFAGITSYSEPEPNYATVVVSRGDTLWTIARKVKPGIDPRKTIYQIKQMNELESVNLKPGQTLIIPM
ncbi:MAG: LysM peptidoglycan-binding domain-containing protein [Firmicutes bacterium]|jgi:hypothetical protein|nr:LysM peptidoglycan-binding domain-containing protein [Bacillota bacterium]